MPHPDTRGSCVLCSAGTVRTSSETSCSECPDDNYATANRKQCAKCPTEGVECTQGILVVLPGYWLPTNLASAGEGTTGASGVNASGITSDTKLYKCPDGACNVDESGSLRCADGRTGPLCAVCEDGHYLQGSTCQVCPPGTVNWPLLVGLSVALAGGFLFSAWRASRMWRTATAPTPPTGAGKPWAVEDAQKLQLGAVGKIAVNYAQVMGFANDFHIPWPQFVADMWTTSGSASSLPMSVSFVACTIKAGFYDTFWAVVASPVALAAVCLVIPVVGKVLRKGSVATWGLYRTSVTVGAYLLYPTVAKRVVQVLDCSVDVAGVSYLEADYREECGTPRHMLHVAVACVVMAVFCLGFPLGLAAMLRHFRRSGELHSIHTRRQWLFLYEEFRDEACWWEAVVILRKFALAAAGASLSGSGHGHQAYVAVLVLVVCLAAQLVVRPHKIASQGRLETFSLMSSAASLYIGILFLLGGLGSVGEAVAVVGLVCINIGFWSAVLVAVCGRFVGKALGRPGGADIKAALPRNQPDEISVGSTLGVRGTIVNPMYRSRREAPSQRPVLNHSTAPVANPLRQLRFVSRPIVRA